MIPPRARPLLALLCVSSLNVPAQQNKENAAGPEKWRKLKLNLGEEKDRPKLSIWSRQGFYQ